MAELQTWKTGIQCPFCQAVFYDIEAYKFHIDGHLASNPLIQDKEPEKE